MIPLVGLALGHLVVPAALLWIGHDYRSRPPHVRRLFWGAVVGYVTAVAAVMALLLAPPVHWGSAGGLRGVGIHGSAVLLPVAFGLLAFLAGGGSDASRE